MSHVLNRVCILMYSITACVYNVCHQHACMLQVMQPLVIECIGR